MLLSVVLIAFSVGLKMNCLIVLIAMAGTLIYDVLLKKHWKETLLYLVLIVIVPAGIHIGSNAFIQRITCMESQGGVPWNAWVAMGLQEGKKAAGSYNGYNLWIYKECGYDSQRAREEASENIRESLQKFKDNPRDALSFGVRKISGQWNNPDCGVLGTGEVVNRNLSWIANSVQAGGLRIFLQWFLNIFQVWILSGAFCYIVLRKDKTDYEWIFLLIFLGGFMFHLFWEAGSRYAFPYYLMLIPYACIGLALLEKKVEGLIKESRKEKKKLWLCWGIGAAIVIISVMGWLPIPGTVKEIMEISDGKEMISTDKGIKDGYYVILPADNTELCLTEGEENILLMSGEDGRQKVSICLVGQNRVIRFVPSQNALELSGGEEVGAKDIVNAFEWKIENAENEQFYILMNDETALTYDMEDWTVRLKEFQRGESSQMWMIVKEGE